MSQIAVNRKQFFVATLTALVLLSSSMLVPSLSAYADHDKGNGKSQDDKSHQKDRKGGHDDHGDHGGHNDHEDKCKHGHNDKYHKHCD